MSMHIASSGFTSEQRLLSVGAKGLDSVVAAKMIEEQTHRKKSPNRETKFPVSVASSKKNKLEQFFYNRSQNKHVFIQERRLDEFGKLK